MPPILTGVPCVYMNAEKEMLFMETVAYEKKWGDYARPDGFFEMLEGLPILMYKRRLI